MNRLFVVRHGNTFLPTEPSRRIGARTDVDLSPIGVEQGTTLGGYFRERAIRFDRIISGPLRRTRQTAALILGLQPAAPALEVASWLIEIDHGPDEGCTEEEVVARIGAAALLDWEEHLIAPAGWRIDLPGRLAKWRELFAAIDGTDILVVTSNGTARIALLAAASVVRHASLKLRTGAFGEMERNADGAMTVLAWDQRP